MPFSHVIKHYVIKGGGSQGLGAAEDWISKGKLRSQLVTRLAFKKKKKIELVGISSIVTKLIALFLPVRNMKTKA